MRGWLQNRRLILSVGLPALVVACAVATWLAMKTGTSAEKQYQRALLALETGDLRAVATAVRRLESVPQFEERARYLRAACLTRRGNRDQALAELAEAPQTRELLVPMLLLVAEAQYREGRLAEAESAARRALEEEPDNVDAHRWLASVLYDLGANQAAVVELSAITRLAPHDFSPHHLLATIEFDSERFQEAASEYRAALERKPPAAMRLELVRGLATALVAHREYAAALQTLETEQNRMALSQDAICLALEAECRWNLGQHDQAQNLLEQAALIDDHELRLLQVRSRILVESGQPAGAVPLLEELLQKDPHDFESRYRLALAFRKLNDAARADEEMRRMRESQALRRKLSDLSDQAVSRPRDARVRDELAAVCEKLAKPELAKLYRQAAEACRQTASPPVSSP